MNIGEEIRTIIVTPIEEPVPQRETRPARREAPTPKPRRAPVRQPATDPAPTRTPRRAPAR